MRFAKPIMAALACAAAVLLVAGAGNARDKKPKADYGAIQRELDGRDQMWTRWAQCPADIYGENRALLSYLIPAREVGLSECEKDPGSCLAACFDGRNEEACFELGRALQENTEREQSRYWEAMFAQACATGSDGGCTNRGAGLLQGGYEDDPFASKAGEVSGCAFRSFEVSCGAGDAWGCTMLGWRYQSGEGTVRDVEKAKSAFTKSCVIDADFIACEYAREELAELEQAK